MTRRSRTPPRMRASLKNMRRRIQRADPLARPMRSIAENRKVLGKNIRVTKNKTTKADEIRITSEGSFHLLGSTPTQKHWGKMTDKQRITYARAVIKIMDNYILNRKVSEFTSREQVVPEGLSIKEQNARVGDFLAKNPKTKLRNETAKTKSQFERVLTKKEKMALLPAEREALIEMSLQELQENMRRVNEKIDRIQKNNSAKDATKQKARVDELEHLLEGLHNRAIGLQQIQHMLIKHRVKTTENKLNFSRLKGPAKTPGSEKLAPIIQFPVVGDTRATGTVGKIHPDQNNAGGTANTAHALDRYIRIPVKTRHGKGTPRDRGKSGKEREPTAPGRAQYTPTRRSSGGKFPKKEKWYTRIGEFFGTIWRGRNRQ